jgi:protein-L-isoaspartate O-methyltransferase
LQRRNVFLQKCLLENKMQARTDLIQRLKKGGISCYPVLKALNYLQREAFIPTYPGSISINAVYADNPIRIWTTADDDENEVLKGYTVTISAPFIHAWSVQEIYLHVARQVTCEEYDEVELIAPKCEPVMPADLNLLEIGYGSGYQTALLATVFPSATIKAIEIVRGLGLRSQQILKDFPNVEARIGDGFAGWPELKFDAIVLSAAPTEIPAALKTNLKIGGMLIGPVGSSGSQEMIKLVRSGENEYVEKRLFGVNFVAMLSSKQEK